MEQGSEDIEVQSDTRKVFGWVKLSQDDVENVWSSFFSEVWRMKVSKTFELVPMLRQAFKVGTRCTSYRRRLGSE